MFGRNRPQFSEGPRRSLGSGPCPPPQPHQDPLLQLLIQCVSPMVAPSVPPGTLCFLLLQNEALPPPSVLARSALHRVKGSFHPSSAQSPFSLGLPPLTPPYASATKHAALRHTCFPRSTHQSCNCTILGFFNRHSHSHKIVNYKSHKGRNIPFEKAIIPSLVPTKGPDIN